MRVLRYVSWQFFLIFGLIGSHTALAGPRYVPPRQRSVHVEVGKPEKIPDFDKYIHVKTLEWTHFETSDAEKRLIVLGDIHGMLEPLENLLSSLEYSPSRDTLIHTGDLTTRGPSSLEVLDFVAARKMLGVRGNHDQIVVEWYTWIEWILRQDKGPQWLEQEERRAIEEKQNSTRDPLVDGIDLPPTKGEEWKQYMPEGRHIMGKHYRIAKNISTEAVSYLYSLPLALHIPQLHTFVVHGGLLPSDPTEDVTADSQPLAHPPSYEDRGEFIEGTIVDSDKLTALRRAQERALLKEVKQNTDPWAILNIRGITQDNQVTKEEDPDDTPWSDVWNSVISLCRGFDVKDRTLSAGARARMHTDQIPLSFANDVVGSSEPKLHVDKIELPCHPVTVIYGHASTRDLDLKRWSKGIDTGCSYGRNLSALVLTRSGHHGHSLDPDHVGDAWGGEIQETMFGEKGLGVEAHIMSVPCSIPDQE